MASASKQATVAQVRSFDAHVHLVIDGGPAGWAPLNDLAHGIAAACQATGTKVHMTYDVHDPDFLGGQGVFLGVKMALQPFKA